MSNFSTKLMLALLLICSLPAATLASPTFPTPSEQATSSTQVSTHLPATFSPNCEAEFTLLTPALPGFAACFGEVNLHSTSQTLSFVLHSQAEIALPPNTPIAFLSVHDPHTGTVTEFQVQTDSGGVMVIISDF